MKTTKILLTIISKPKSFIWAILIAKTILKVIIIRLWRGPALENWPFKLELLVEIIRLRTLPKQIVTKNNLTYYDIKNEYFPGIRKRWTSMSLPPHKHFRATYKFLHVKFSPSPLPENAAKIIGVQQLPEPVSDISAEWIISSEPTSDKITILYLHGGGYCMGSPKSYERMVSMLIKYCNASQALILDYKLAPENPFPSPLLEAYSSYQYLLSQGIKSDKIVIMGDSAGGGLTLATSLFLRDTNSEMPRALVCLSPWTNLLCTGDSWDDNKQYDYLSSREEALGWAMKYSNGVNLTHPLISPLYANLNNLPPILIQYGGKESLADDSKSIYQKLIGANSMVGKVKLEEFKDMVHVFQMFGKWAPLYRDAFISISDFVNNFACSALQSYEHRKIVLKHSNLPASKL